MGYTHYFIQKKSIAPDMWKKICRDTEKIIHYQIKLNIYLQSNDSSDVMVNEEKGFINFNGVLHNKHETFSIKKDLDKDFNFCKTARLPYDLAVTAVLMIIDYHAPECFQISSSGKIYSWLPAAKMNKILFGYGIKFPYKVKFPHGVSQEELKNSEKMEKYVEELYKF